MKRLTFLIVFLIISGSLFGQSSDTDWKYDKYWNENIATNTDWVQNLYLRHFSNLGFFAGKTVVYNGFLFLIDYLHITDLAVLTKNELRILRNMIYAKHGYIFQNNDWTKYFSDFNWYNPRHRNVDTMLTEHEKWLIEVILAFENMKPTRHTKSDYVREWYNTPVPAGWPDLIEIKNDNTINFVYNEMRKRAAISCRGTYTVENGLLVVNITEQLLNGGKYFHSGYASTLPGMEHANEGVFRFNSPVRMVFSIDVLVKYFPTSPYANNLHD
jgi:hypothetical protein